MSSFTAWRFPRCPTLCPILSELTLASTALGSSQRVLRQVMKANVPNRPLPGRELSCMGRFLLTLDESSQLQVWRKGWKVPSGTYEVRAQTQLLFIEVGDRKPSLGTSAFWFIFPRKKRFIWGFCGEVKNLKKALQYSIYKSLRALLDPVHLAYYAKLVMKLEQYQPLGWGWRERSRCWRGRKTKEAQVASLLSCLCQVGLPQLSALILSCPTHINLD